MKKVLYVFGGEKASGAEIVIKRLIDYNLKNIQPFLFVSPGRFADELIAEDKGYPIIIVERLRKLNRSNSSALTFISGALKNYLLISFKVIKYINKNKINIIHANTIVPASYLIPAIIYCWFFNLKKSWIWSDHDLKYFSKVDKVASQICVSLYNKTLVVSEAVKRKFGNVKSVFVLYNGLDLNVYKPKESERVSFRKKYNFSDRDVVFSICATISPRKGQLQLIQVFKHILSTYTNINLVIAGSFGPDNDKYNNDVFKAINNNSNIIYLGHINNMTEVYNGSDVIINNSNKKGSEPLGTTIYEAMACEKIVIASNTGGTPEIIDNKEDGFVFEAENEASLKETMEYVIVNINSLSKMRVMARRKVVKKFSLNSMSNNYNKCI